MNELTTQQEEISKVPRWKVVVQKLLSDGITYGAIIEADTLENLLCSKRNTIDFSFEVSLIRRALEEHGLYLTGRGQNGDRYVVVQARENHKQMSNYIAESRDCLKRAVKLGSATDTSLLTQQESSLHAQILERAQNKLALMNRRKLN